MHSAVEPLEILRGHAGHETVAELRANVQPEEPFVLGGR
jgi:hypothetical protein